MSMQQYFESVWEWFKDKEHEEVTKCYVCDGEVFRKDGDIATCCNCEFVFRWRQPTNQTLLSFYNDSIAMNHWSIIKESPDEVWRQLQKFDFVYGQIKETKPRKILDVGCGNGFFLNNNKTDALRVGIEPNKDAAQHCKFPVYSDYTEFINSINGRSKYDLITFFGVVEHLKDPLKEIKQYSQHLSDNGKIAIIVPNVKSLLVKTLWQEASTFCPQHLWYFSFETLSLMMQKIGFEFGFCTSVESELKPVMNKINGYAPYDKSSPIKYPKELEDGVIGQHLGYKLIAFYSKNIL